MVRLILGNPHVGIEDDDNEILEVVALSQKPDIQSMRLEALKHYRGTACVT